MKKIVFILSIISFIFIVNNKDEIIIPDDSIRFRIIANSNNLDDQIQKNNIKNYLINNIFPYFTNDIESNISLINEFLKDYKIDYSINFGDNYFPQKTYKGVIYPSGKYKSLIVTLGNGLGNNFWCVMYPPLCLIDNQENTSNIEYKSLVIDMLNKYQNM